MANRRRIKNLLSLAMPEHLRVQFIGEELREIIALASKTDPELYDWLKTTIYISRNVDVEQVVGFRGANKAFSKAKVKEMIERLKRVRERMRKQLEEKRRK